MKRLMEEAEEEKAERLREVDEASMAKTWILRDKEEMEASLKGKIYNLTVELNALRKSLENLEGLHADLQREKESMREHLAMVEHQRESLKGEVEQVIGDLKL